METLTKPADRPDPAPSDPAPPTLHRLWLRWVLLVVFVAVLGTVFVNLSEWQLDRLHQRQARNATTVANERAPVRPYAEVFTHPITDADAWQRVSAVGTFDAAHQFVVRFRNNGDTSGYEIVTPLQTSTGAVLVSRGFITRQGMQQLPTTAPPPPGGEVHVVGYVQASEPGRSGATVPNGQQIRLINSAALQQTIPYPIADGYISAITVDPPQDGGFTPIILPEISNGPHFWYAVQWFMFTAIGVAGIVVFIRGDLKDRRLARAAAARAVNGAGTAPPPDSP